MKVQQNGPMMDAEEIQVHLNDKQRIAGLLMAKIYVPREDVEAFGCSRYAARIKDLRDEGWEIETVYGKSRRGTRCALGYKLIQAPVFAV